MKNECQLKLNFPQNGRILIFDSSGNLIYDNIIIHNKTLHVNDKCYIECIGNQFGDQFTIIAD